MAQDTVGSVNGSKIHIKENKRIKNNGSNVLVI